jgi:hypothetical protein|tara:strand:- start:705 stop:1166 length:462 start_codon:yes stop_codon:yes gene_type:complete
MAATAWQVYYKAKQYLGDNTIQLGTAQMRMVLASAGSNAATLTLSNYVVGGASGLNGEVAAGGTYVQGGNAFTPTFSGGTVTAAKYTMATAGVAFTASGSNITGVKFAVIRSSATSTTGKLLCFCQLSSANFNVVAPNTLTVLPAAAGIFTLT